MIKLNISIKQIKKATKSLKIGSNGLKIEAKEEDCIITDAKGIIFLHQAFHIYMQTFVFLATLSNKI